jgi:hypothetical protein
MHAGLSHFFLLGLCVESSRFQSFSQFNQYGNFELPEPEQKLPKNASLAVKKTAQIFSGGFENNIKDFY